MRSFNETSGTYQGDPNDIWITSNITINDISLTVDGMLSYYGSLLALSNSYTLPSPSASITYISIQTDNNGDLQLYTSITSALTLQTGNIMEIYSDIIPINATTDEVIISDNEPVLD
jgi:hypothetical protein